MSSSPVVFITGSAKRIGAVTARHLHAQGYRVVIHCRRSREQGQSLVDALNQQRANSAALVCSDLSELAQIEAVAADAKAAFGRVDVLINNASAFYPTPIGTISAEDWHSLVGSNMQAPLFLSQALTAELAENQGVILNMTDIHAQRPLSNHTLYCMAKAALVTMTQSLAKELAPAVRVNAVAPGAILWPETSIDDGDKQGILNQIPLARLGTAEDIAGAIYFLITAPYITGQILAVDGGRSLAGAYKA